MLRIVTAKTEIEAQRKYDQLQSNYHLQAQLVSYAGDTGIDISRYADGDALSTHTEGMTSYVMRADGSGKPLTAGDVKQRFANVTRGSDLILVGTPQQVAERIEEHARISGTTGYMLNPLISPGSLEDFVELVIPEFQKRGLYRTEPQRGTLRSRLRADGASHLPASAYGASFRFDRG